MCIRDRYYTTTLLSNSVTPSAIYDLEAKIDAYALFDPADIDAANEILYAEKVTGKQKQRLTFFLQKSKKLLEHYEYEEQREAVSTMRSFVRYYEFLLQVSCFCLLYTSDAADDLLCVDLGARRIIKKKPQIRQWSPCSITYSNTQWLWLWESRQPKGDSDRE